MMPNIDHKINLLHQTNRIVVDPPPQIIAKACTGATAHHFTQADSQTLVEVQQQKMGPQVILPDNSTIDPEQVDHLTLTLKSCCNRNPCLLSIAICILNSGWSAM